MVNLNEIVVIKRDGREVEYNREKIINAIQKAFNACNVYVDINKISDAVEDRLKQLDNRFVDIEDIQKIIVSTIRNCGYPNVAKEFNAYREQRSKARNKRDKLFKIIGEISNESSRENANVGRGPSSKLLQFAETVGRKYTDLLLTDQEIINAMNSNLIYPHDHSWEAVGTTTCCYIPFDKLLLNGFSTGHGYLRTPQSINSAMSLAAIIFQANQNDQHGGQASAFFDSEMAPFIKRDFENKKIKLRKLFEEVNTEVDEAKLEEVAWEATQKATMQACEAFVHNMNTLHSRAGAQVPFTSVNIGTDTTKEGRLLTKCLLEAYNNGLGKGEQPLFPNIIFKVKNGVNYEEGTPNHDLLELSFKVTANRLYPIYNFQDCTLNKDFPTDVPSMGCRTRVAWDRHLPKDEQTVLGRGNLSFTTINLPGLVLNIKDHKEDLFQCVIDDEFSLLKEKYNINLPKDTDLVIVHKFFIDLNDLIELTAKQLYNRYKHQGSFKKRDFPFLMDGVWIDSEKLNPNVEVRDVLKHGTLTVGMIGLAECLKGLYGKHHGESEVANELGLEIIKFMNKKVCDECSELYDMNFSLLGTPAEGLTGKLLERDLANHGKVKGMTDKEWYTNSTHVPVEYDENFIHKIKVEGQYVKYLNGGNITYVELSSSPKDNVKAIADIVKIMHDNDIALGAINYPCDRCAECGYSGTIDSDTCPKCGSKDIKRIRRITGYLAPLDNFNYAKKQEALHRVKHDKEYLERDC